MSAAEDEEVFNHLLDRHSDLLETVLTAVESADPEQFYYVAGCEAFDGIEALRYEKDEPLNMDDLNRLWVHAPGAVFFAQRVKWTNLPEPEPTVDSWLVIVVIPGKPAIFFARNIGVELWDPFPVMNAPLFAVSTASSMRRAQEIGEAVPEFKNANDKPELFKTVDGHLGHE